MRVMVDPPSGWKYGFPVEADEEMVLSEDKYMALLRAHNYPEDMIDLALKYTRYWNASGGACDEQ